MRKVEQLIDRCATCPWCDCDFWGYTCRKTKQKLPEDFNVYSVNVFPDFCPLEVVEKRYVKR